MTTLFNGWGGGHWTLGEGEGHRYSLWCRLMYSYDYPVLANPPPVRPTSRAAIREGCGAHCGGPQSFPMLPTTPNQLALAAWPAVLQKQSPNCSQQPTSRRPPAVGVVRIVAFLHYRLTPHRRLLASPPPKPRLLAALDGCWRGLCHLCKPLADRYRPTAAANGGKGATRRGRGGGHQRPRFACHPSRPCIALRWLCQPSGPLARSRLCVANRK